MKFVVYREKIEFFSQLQFQINRFGKLSAFPETTFLASLRD